MEVPGLSLTPGFTLWRMVRNGEIHRAQAAGTSDT
jgi:hypothetical protein